MQSCIQCGSQTPNKKFCSQKCNGTYQYSRRDKATWLEHRKAPTEKVEVACTNCGTKLQRSRTYIEKHGGPGFCGHSCAAKFRKVFLNRAGTGKPKVTLPCLTCGKEISTVQAERKYCSNRCRGAHDTATFIESVVASDGSGFSKQQLRSYLVKTHGWRCSICSIERWVRGPVPLVMDHIDGNKYNDSLSNLRLVCRNCDGELPTFAWRNAGRYKTSAFVQQAKDPGL